MEYEYRYLSKEKAAEIDAKGFVNNLGKKININSIKSVVNNNETVIFRQIWFSHEQDDSDVYFFVYNGGYYFVDMFSESQCEKKDNYCNYYDKYSVSKICNTTFNKDEHDVRKILELLKDIVTEWNLKTSGKIDAGDKVFTKLIYNGEEI